MNEGRYRRVGNAFGISRSSVSLFARRICKAIATQLGPKFVKLPSIKEEVSYAVDKFEKLQWFPHCFEAVVGNPTYYVNRKNGHSLNVQAITKFTKHSLNVQAKVLQVLFH